MAPMSSHSPTAPASNAPREAAQFGLAYSVHPGEGVPVTPPDRREEHPDRDENGAANEAAPPLLTRFIILSIDRTVQLSRPGCGRPRRPAASGAEHVTGLVLGP